MAAKTDQYGGTQYKDASHRIVIWISSRKGLEIYFLVSHQVVAVEKKRWYGFSTNTGIFNPCFRPRLVVKLASDKGNFLLNDTNQTQLIVFTDIANKLCTSTTLITRFPKSKTPRYLKTLGLFFLGCFKSG